MEGKKSQTRLSWRFSSAQKKKKNPTTYWMTNKVLTLETPSLENWKTFHAYSLLRSKPCLFCSGLMKLHKMASDSMWCRTTDSLITGCSYKVAEKPCVTAWTCKPTSFLATSSRWNAPELKSGLHTSYDQLHVLPDKVKCALFMPWCKTSVCVTPLFLTCPVLYTHTPSLKLDDNVRSHLSAIRKLHHLGFYFCTQKMRESVRARETNIKFRKFWEK